MKENNSANLRNAFTIVEGSTHKDVKDYIDRYFTFNGVRWVALKIQMWCEAHAGYRITTIREAANNAANATSNEGWARDQLAVALNQMRKDYKQLTIKVVGGTIAAVVLTPGSDSDAMKVVIDAKFSGTDEDIAHQFDLYIDRFILGIPLPRDFDEKRLITNGLNLTPRVRFVSPTTYNEYPVTIGNLMAVISHADEPTVLAVMPSFFGTSNRGAESAALRDLFAVLGAEPVRQEPSLDDILRDFLN